MSAHSATWPRGAIASFGVVGLGFALALASDLAMNALSLAKLSFLLGGFVLLIPTIVLKDPKAYWLFLLVLSIPFDISKWLSDPSLTANLAKLYGAPASGTVSLEVYITDVLQAAMLLPWLARVCMRREKLFFPSLGYLFFFYLAWSLIVSLINSQSFALSMFELYRQTMYFLFFVYMINNLNTRLQVMSTIWAVAFGVVIGAGSVIVFFERGIGTDTVAFAFLHDQAGTSSSSHKGGGKDEPQALTLNTTGRIPLGSSGEIPGIKRSQGIFRHPAIPAGFCGLVLPMFLAYLLTARNNRDRFLLAIGLAWGLGGLLLTFSRAGLIGLLTGSLLCLVIAGWFGLISRRALTRTVLAFTLVITLSIPLTVIYLTTRPDAFYMRFSIFAAALQGYAQHPILGVGLNNGTAAMKAGRRELLQLGVPIPPDESAESYYISTFIEVGPVGTVLFFGFMWRIVAVALRTIKTARPELKPLLVGMVAGIGSVATQSLIDGPMAGHAVSGNFWVFAALIVAIARTTRPETHSLSDKRPAEPSFI